MSEFLDQYERIAPPDMAYLRPVRGFLGHLVPWRDDAERGPNGEAKALCGYYPGRGVRSYIRDSTANPGWGGYGEGHRCSKCFRRALARGWSLVPVVGLHAWQRRGRAGR